MTYSLNEIDALAKKAARGAGYSWGLSEDAGKAVRFLCGQGLDGCAALADVLRRVDQVPQDRLKPFLCDGVWSCSNEILCPIRLGAAWSDRAYALDQNRFVAKDVRQPIILAAFAAHMARAHHAFVVVTSGDAELATDGAAVSVARTMPNQAKRVTLAIGDCTSIESRPLARANPSPEVVATLNAFAHRTYAPATEESRRRGAG